MELKKQQERQKIEHEKMQAEKYKKIREQNESMRINFKNKVMRIIDLPSHTTQFDVYRLCKAFGRIKCIYMGIDYESKLCKGYCFVCCYTEEDCKNMQEHINKHLYDYNVLNAEIV